VLVDESSEVALIKGEDDVVVDISTRFGRVEARVVGMWRFRSR
jgi:hypothetical protein